MGDPQRYVLGLAYQAGPDERIQEGVDGGRDYITPEELEKAAWTFLRKRGTAGLFHEPDTEGAAEIVESYIYRGPDWTVPGTDVVVKSGDWLVGAIMDEPTWQMYQAGQVDGWSILGSGQRVTQAGA